jgi:hypothetical protein
VIQSPASKLLAECQARGIRLRPGDDGTLIVGGPNRFRTPEILARLRSHKADVLAALRIGNDGEIGNGEIGNGGEFDDWILRPDVGGTLGWERPGLREADRWWARGTPDDLLDAGKLFDALAAFGAKSNA